MRDPISLTRRQREIYEHLLRQHQAGETPPGLQALCQQLGLRSRGSLHKHIQALVEAGLVAPMHGRQRGVRVLPEHQDSTTATLPVLGSIAAGLPLDAVVDNESLAVPSSLLKKGPHFVLRVSGDSMQGAGILDGDWVVVQQSDTARNGEIVVALIDGSEVTLKRIEQSATQLTLHAENPDYSSQNFAPDRVAVQGRVVAQMRRY